MPIGYQITGIQPRELDRYPLPVKLMYWKWVTDLGIIAKDRDLAAGLDAEGEPLLPISAQTRRHRKSEMTPDGSGDPTAPPLTPGRELSRTRSLLAGKAFPDRAEFYWRFDPWTGDQWGVILQYQQEQGRDVFGLSPDSTDWVRLQALARWRKWLLNPVVPKEFEGKGAIPPLPAAGTPTRIEDYFGVGRMDLSNATLGINAPGRSRIEGSQQRQGGMTEAELKAFYRGTAPAAVQGRPGTSYNRLLGSIWGSPGEGRGIGGVQPLVPPRPTPAKAALRPAVPPLPTFGPSPARVVVDPDAVKEIHARIKRALGKNATPETAATIAGAPAGTTADIFEGLSGPKSLLVYANGPGISIKREIQPDVSGKPKVHNIEVFIDKDKQGHGLGTEILGRQIEAARKAGMSHLYTSAIRDDLDRAGTGIGVGYKVWPKLGYDAELAQSIRVRLPGGLKDAKRISDLYATPEGRAWWEANGETISLKFDLTPGSYSLRVWEAYLRAKRGQ